MLIKMFGKDFEVKDHHCNFNDHPGLNIDEPYVNLYVRLTNICTAKCKFCEFHADKSTEFDIYKFLYTIARLSKEVRVNKVSFTGGEPTINVELLNRLLKEVKGIDPTIFTVVNTNGWNFTKIDPEYVNSIALSRHHILNHINNQILGLAPYGIWVSNFKDIENYPHKDKLHLSCNLIKGYVDSKKECRDYIEYFGQRGVQDIGFVTLMNVNEYAHTHQVDFSDIKLDEMSDTIKSQSWRKVEEGKVKCKCCNYLTFTQNGNIVKSYARYYSDRSECKGILVYEPDGKLTNGFEGEIINE